MTSTLLTTQEPATSRRSGLRAGRALVTSALFDQLVRRISADGGLDDNLAERVVDQAIAFLAACAHNTLAPLSPSALVDVGWHAFLLHTREYATFCHEVAGRFLHHVPTTDDSPTDQPAHEKLARTVAAIRAAGFAVDADLWNHGDAGDCTGCHTGCHDDPPPARR